MTIADEVRQYSQMLMASFNGRAPFVLAVVDTDTGRLMILSNASDVDARNALIEAILECAIAQTPEETEVIERTGNSS